MLLNNKVRSSDMNDLANRNSVNPINVPHKAHIFESRYIANVRNHLVSFTR